jgi:hypothetical protein
MLKKILAGVSAMALSLGMIALVAGPAAAHTGDLNVVAVCNTDTGNYDFTATLVISQTNEVGATMWKVGNGNFAGTPTSNAGLTNGPVASTGAMTITLTTFSLPGSTTGLGPWVYAFTTWSPDNFKKGSDGQLLTPLDGSCNDTPDSKKISFCHWDGGSGKYSAITTSLNAFYVSGHIDHAGDIFPAGSIVKKGVTYSWAAQGNQAQLQYEDCLIPITPTAPTFVAAICSNGASGNGSYTIPTTAGVSYFVNGSSTAKPAGTYPVTPVATISIVAKVTAGNTSSKLTGTTTWSFDFASAGTCVTTPATPTVTDQVCTVNTDGNGTFTSGYITIPTTNHVQYSIDGTIAAAGQHPFAAGTHTVTAVALDGYGLTGYPAGGWSLTIHDALACGNVTPAAPSVTDQVCTVGDNGNGDYTSGFITIPSSTKVSYFIDGSPASAGQHNLVPGTYTVTAVAVPNYTLVGYPAGGWSLTIHEALACGNVTPAAPSVTDQVCTVGNDGNGDYTSGFITIPSSTKVSYFIDGSPASAGQHDLASGTYTVTAVALANYTLTGYPAGGWSETIHDALACGDVTPTPPSVSDETCAVNKDGNGTYTSGSITIPASTTVDYFIDGSPVSAGTHDYAVGTHTVTAVAHANYTLVGYPAGGWPETIGSAKPCGDVHPVDPTVVDQSCVVLDNIGSYHSGYIDLPAAGNVTYFIDGVAAGTHNELAPGTYQVTATAVPNYTLVGYPDGGWSETIHAAEPCGQLVDHPVLIPLVTFVQLGCTTNGSYTLSNDIGAADGVIWTVDGSQVAQGTYQVTSARTVTVHAAANGPAYGLNGTPQVDWTLTFVAATTCDLKTLALTGTTPTGGMLLAYFMLLAGIGIITVRAVRRHGRPQE